MLTLALPLGAEERPAPRTSQPCVPHPQPSRARLNTPSGGIFPHNGFILAALTLLTLSLVTTPCAGDIRGPFTPPPSQGDRPVVSDNIVWFLKYIPKHCQDPSVTRYPSGGVVQGKKALLQRDNPHRVYGNIEIPSDACLYIEPGCELRFGPGFGIIVNGTLIARGSDEAGGRITMTKDQGTDSGAPTGDWKSDARLSSGNTTQDGRLDLLHQGKWRAVCTNYQNFTEMDVNVTCRNLGFLKGNFTYHSFARNLTDYMVWERPGCLGTEDNLLQCPGAQNIRVGAHICDGQQVVGFECEGLRPGLALDHWRGIQFFNSTSHSVRHDDNVYLQESWSWLEYLDIRYPGLDSFHGRTTKQGVYYPIAAISASPLVPLMNNVTIMYGAYDGLNLTEVTGPIHIANSTIHKNRGYGIFIQSAVGMTKINMTQVTENWGDGVKFYLSNLTIHDFRTNFTFSSGFCYRSDSSNQIYPIFQHLDAVSFDGEKLLGTSCARTFSTTGLKTVNLHFLMMENDPEASGTLTVKEGSYGVGALIGVYNVANGSLPQSVRTKSRTMWIRFDYKLPRGGCNTFKPCLRFLLRLSTANGTEEEFRMDYSSVSDNVGYGVNIQDMRSAVSLNTSSLSRNGFGAGLRVYQGAGEVIVNNTLLEANAHCGINITYSGGYTLLNNTRLIANKGYGVITEYLRLNRSRIEFMHKLEVVRGEFSFNELIGLRVGNYCRGGSVFVNESSFSYNVDEAIEYLSCNVSTGLPSRPVNFSVGYTDFTGNQRHAILAQPLLNTVGIITNCSFTNHSLGTIRIDNGYDLLVSKWYREFPVSYDIFENRFERNRGRYVVYLRLTDKSPLQGMRFKFNKLKHNSVQESFVYTNPRSRANAVAVVSSDNVQFSRNILANRGPGESVREMATHLLDPAVRIDAKENYWDIEIVRPSDFEQVHLNIFDQDDRYNLALIDYQPALKTDRYYEDQLTTDVPTYRWSFSRPGNIIGGILDFEGFEAQEGQTYYVDRDIYVNPDQLVRLNHRVTLEFAPSVGMVVHGTLKADGGDAAGTIHFKLWTDPELLPLENRTASVRLSNGTDLYEGRLEVLIDDEWGTVCSEGWTDEAAALVCLQLGLIYNPDAGAASVRVVAPPGMPVLLSWVACDPSDQDLTQCRAVRPPDVGCQHRSDVYLRCQDPTWAGITLPATTRLGQTQESQLRALHLERAGLLDAETMSFSPALRIDYNFYQITAITITDSLSDGVHINYVFPYETPRLEYMQIHNNRGNGVVTRFPRLDLRHSNISGSGAAGFLYDPFFSEYTALSVRSLIHKTKRRLLTETPTLDVASGRMEFLLCPAGLDSLESQDYHTEISTSPSTYRIVLQILDFYPVTEVEAVTVFDAPRANIGQANVKQWRIPDDLVDFPIMSSGQTLTIRLTVRGIRSGRLSFAVISQIAHTGPPDLTTSLYNVTLTGNYRGIQTKHYNSPSNRRLDIFHRFKQETISFERITVRHSAMEAVHMPSVTKFSDDYIPTYEDMTRAERVATIRYNVTLATLEDNQVGILAEHNHVDFANNVWQWHLAHVTMRRSRSGGVMIEVPRVNDAAERMKHSVTLVESVFTDNLDFGCEVKGYYTDVRLENNLFERNQCLLGLLTIAGMEKNISLFSNRITGNVGRYMLDVNILSHSEYSQQVLGVMRQNDIRGNTHRGLTPPGVGNSPRTFAVAFRGVQNMTANRNLFDNPDLGYELVAGVTALFLGNPVDVTENYWGVTYYFDILERIFDFDDWNNYALADCFPFLTKADFAADLSGGEAVAPPLDTGKLGGRISLNQVLQYDPRPYIVEKDLTIMPNVTFTIPAGVELQFRPNIGILVLGRLMARGVEYNRIRMRPVQPDADAQNSPAARKRRGADAKAVSGTKAVSGAEAVSGARQKRASTTTLRLRGDGTLFQDSGFLEMYNTSTKTWNIMCDSQFNDKSAEVVCRQLGKETVNVQVRHTHLYDHYIYGEPQYFLKEFWFETYFCRGDETDLRQCTTRYNYNLQACIAAGNYTFMVCGERNLEAGLEYWGNVRFAPQSYQEQPLESDIGRQESVMSYVDIEGAGMLHGEKVGAIQTTYVSPKFSHINVSKCAENGLDVIAPRGILTLSRVNVSNNLGFGVNFLVLNGESSVRDSSFLLLGASTIPYHVHGLVEACRMEKEVELHTRMILYYKYGPNTRDCVKTVRSGNGRSHIGLRFLQINMFHEDFSRNVIEIFDGSSNSPDNLLVEIQSNTSAAAVGRLYQSTGDTLTVHMHASVSHGSYGFIAEVVQVPLTGLTYPDSNYKHTVVQSIASHNQAGALRYRNVGEINPSLFIDQCWLEGNGVTLLNLTSPPTIDISLQGTLLFRFHSNFVSGNSGGTHLSLHTQNIATAIKGNLTNNVFTSGTNGEALNISGHYFQRLYVFQNTILNYTTGDWRDVVHIRDVTVNYTYNYLDNNTGHYILNTYGGHSGLRRQEFTRSGFVRNNATALTESTIKVSGGQPFFENNYIVNTDNDFEMETYPKIDQTDAPINAKNNWWGSELRSYINGKLWDNFDDSNLLAVEFWQPKLDNRSVVEGKCAPGWKLDTGRCYRFMGGALPYYKARDFCRAIGAFLGEARGREGFFNYLLRLMRSANEGADRVWVMSEVGSSRCSALEHSYIVYEEDCWNLLYPFLCEKDPYLAPPEGLEDTVRAMAIGIGAGIGGVLVLVALILGILWCVKSQRREKERFERTASMRSSMRMSKSNLTMLSVGRSRLQLDMQSDGFSQASSGATKASRGTENLNGSMGSLNQRNYRNGGRAAAMTVDRNLGDRRGAVERDRGRERERERERERDMRRGRGDREEEREESYAGSRGREESESERDKKEFDDDSEEQASSDSDWDEEEETEPEEVTPERRSHSDDRLDQGYGRVHLPGLAGRAQSRDNVYENHDNNQPYKSKSMSSFNQPETPESPVSNNTFHLPRRQDLPTPPPTPRSTSQTPYARGANPPNQSRGANPPNQYPPRPQPPPKPSTRPPAFVHPGLQHLRDSPVPSEGSLRSESGRPSPVPRKMAPSSQASSSPRATPVPLDPSYQNHRAQPLPPKSDMGSQEFEPRVHLPSAGDSETYNYRPRSPHLSPSHRIPNLPRYSPPLPMDGPPSYEESDRNLPYFRQEPEYLRRDAPSTPYVPTQDPPEQDVQYLPRFHQPDRRQFPQESPRRMGGSRENLGGSRGQLNQGFSPVRPPPDVLYLNNENRGRQPAEDHLETEI